MKRSIVSLAVAAAVVVGGVFILSASAKAQSHHNRTTTKSKVESYVVVKISGQTRTGAPAGDQAAAADEYKVFSTTALATEEKRIKDDNKKKLEEWEDARRADPSLERPVRVRIKRIASGFKTQEGAQKYIDEIKEKEEGGDKK